VRTGSFLGPRKRGSPVRFRQPGYPRGVAIPWTRIARLAPVVLGLAREILDRRPPARTGPDPNLSARLGALEETERRQAEALHALAEETAALAEAASGLRRQLRTLLVVAVVAAALAAAALLVAVLR